IHDERVVPIAGVFARHAETRAARVDAVVEVLRHGAFGIWLPAIGPGIEMQAAGDAERVPAIGARDDRAAVQHLDDRRAHRIGRCGWRGWRGLHLRHGLVGDGLVALRLYDLRLEVLQLLIESANLLAQR